MLVKKSFTITNKHGLHARPSASFVKIANQYDSAIRVEYDQANVDGKSILGLMTLGAGKGSHIKVTAEGDDADKAMSKLGELIHAGFNEE